MKAMEKLDTGHQRLRHRRRVANLAVYGHGQASTTETPVKEKATSPIHDEEQDSRAHPPTPTSSISNLPLEILQQICLYLSFWDLLRFRRVSRSWHQSAPGHFSSLRRALFLPPPPGAPCDSRSLLPAMRLHVSVHLEQRHGFGHRSTMEYRINAFCPSSGFRYGLPSIVAVNPMIRNIATYIRRVEKRVQLRRARAQKGDYFEDKACMENEMELWEQMFTIMPPAQEVEIHCNYLGGYETLSGLFVPEESRKRVLRNADGVKMGDLASRLGKMVRKVFWEIEIKWPS